MMAGNGDHRVLAPKSFRARKNTGALGIHFPNPGLMYEKQPPPLPTPHKMTETLLTLFPLPVVLTAQISFS